MGAALVAPVVALLVLGLIFAVYFTRSASKARRAEETLPDEPYARREEEIRRLRAGHEESDPSRVTHPARRPQSSHRAAAAQLPRQTPTSSRTPTPMHCSSTSNVG